MAAADIKTFILRTIEKEFDKEEHVILRKGKIVGSLMLCGLLQEACLSREDIKNLFMNTTKRILGIGFIFLESLREDLDKIGHFQGANPNYPLFINDIRGK